MSNLRISILQQPLIWMDHLANLQHFAQLIDKLDGMDLIILPEMFSSGFAMHAEEHAQPSEVIEEWLAAQAIKSQAAICGSAAVQTPHGLVNRFLFVTPEGMKFYYDKRHLFRMAREHQHYQSGHRRVIITWRSWRILPQICYDLRFPVFSRNQNDYDLIIYVANWPAARAEHWNILLRARAIENQAWLIGCNRVGEDALGLSYQGNSQIINPLGEIIAQTAENHASIIQGTIALQQVSEYRQRFPAWQDADNFTLN